MAFSASLCHQVLSRRFVLSQNRLISKSIDSIKTKSFQVIKSALNSSRLSLDDNGASGSARVSLKRLFAQTQWIGERANGDSSVDLEILESDLEAVLKALKKKEEDRHNAEREVLSENQKLDRARDELARRKSYVAESFSEYEKLERELEEANFSLANQARKIEELKLLVDETEREISVAQSALALKEDDLRELTDELGRKSEEAGKVDFELKEMARVLDEVNGVVRKQEIEIEELKRVFSEKEEELAVSESARKLEEERVEAAKASLEEQEVQWFLAQEELKKLEAQAAKQMGDTNETMEDSRRVENLLADMRSELVSSQKFLAYSRKQIEEQEHLFKMQLVKHQEQRESVASYMTSLKTAQVEFESERVKLRVAEARNILLEQYLSTGKELVEELREDLNKEKSSLKQAILEMSFLQQELEKQTDEFEKMQDRLQTKEAEVVKAKLAMQHSKSEQAASQLVLEEGELELSNGRKKLEDLKHEVMELKMLMKDKEDQLMQATTMQKEKNEHAQMRQDELDETKVRISEAETVVEHAVDLSFKMGVSIKDEAHDKLREYGTLGYELMQPLKESCDDFEFEKKQLEIALILSSESLRAKEMEILAAERALKIKDKELKTAIAKLEARQTELRSLKEELVVEANDLKKLCAMAQERIGDRTMADLAIEKLQIEAAQLEVEAVTCALQNLTALSRQLASKASSSIKGDTELSLLVQNGSDTGINVLENNEYLKQVATEVIRLSFLSDQLVKEANAKAAQSYTGC